MALRDPSADELKRREDWSDETSQKGRAPSSSQRPGKQTIQQWSPDVVQTGGTWNMSPTCSGTVTGAASAERGGRTDRDRDDRIWSGAGACQWEQSRNGDGQGRPTTWGTPAGDLPIGEEASVGRGILRVGKRGRVGGRKRVGGAWGGVQCGWAGRWSVDGHSGRRGDEQGGVECMISGVAGGGCR